MPGVCRQVHDPPAPNARAETAVGGDEDDIRSRYSAWRVKQPIVTLIDAHSVAAANGDEGISKKASEEEGANKALTGARRMSLHRSILPNG